MGSQHDRDASDATTLQDQTIVQLSRTSGTHERFVTEHDHGRSEVIPDRGELQLHARGRDTPGHNPTEWKHGLEQAAVGAFCTAWNRAHSTSLVAFHVDEEDPRLKREFEGWDGLLLGPKGLRAPDEYIQVARVDSALPEALARGQVQRRYDAAALATRVNTAVASKQKRYPQDFCARTHLVLAFPTPLGDVMRAALLGVNFVGTHFKSLWIAPVGEDAFLVASRTP